MAISNNPQISDKTIHNLVMRRYKQAPGSANELLEECSLTEDQKNVIRTILATRFAPGQTQENMEKQIALALAERVTPQNRAQEDESIAEIGNLLDVIPNEILRFCLLFCGPKEEFAALSLTCKSLKTMILDVCIQQLRMKKLLTKAELDIYQQRLGGEFNNWGCVFKHCEQLEELDFSQALRLEGTPTQNRELDLILRIAKQYCPLITKLNFSKYSSFGNNTLLLLGKEFQDLTHLNLSFCGYVPSVFIKFTKCCPNLRSLNLSYHPVSNESVISISNDCKNLNELILTNSCSTSFERYITNETITVLAEKCPLIHLAIPKSAITDTGLNALANCKGLRSLCLDFCRMITEDAVAALEQQLPNLEIPKENLSWNVRRR